jgi:[ribosomal protein S5]-alanine N-acetyltransferase
LQIADSPQVVRLAGDKRVYETTIAIPHPYEEGMAEQWISGSVAHFYSGTGVDFAIILKETGDFIGATGLVPDAAHNRADLGYWIGVPYWNQGYCTEAVVATIRYGFAVLGYHKISARHMVINPASGKVMEKAGMKLEGELVDDVVKDGRFHTMRVYGILNKEHPRHDE